MIEIRNLSQLVLPWNQHIRIKTLVMATPLTEVNSVKVRSELMLI